MSFVPAIGLGSINMPELLIILVIVLVFFGAGKLPSVFRQLGSGMKAFKDAQKDDPVPSRDITPSAKELTTDAVTDAEEVGERIKE